ncbi:HMG box [Ancylostoma caninum]|uniref:HMG box n=1 Tax=Ancylostoma caninum TaxID=29170 RepID=A0A368FRN4_ANCCA|nr:HMG box [Ancylostoma caninum]
MFNFREKNIKYPATGMTMGPCAIFVKEHFAKNAPKNLSEGKKTMREAAAAWKSLDSVERKKYEDLSKRYRDEKMREFDALSDEEKQERIASSLEMKEEKAKRRERKQRRENWEKTGHPERPPSAYNLYVQEKFNELKKKGEVIVPVSKTMEVISAQWSAMSQSAREPYTKKASVMADQYKTELDAWKAKVEKIEEKKSKKS